MSSNRIQRNFAGGELAPALHGKNDLVKYQTGAKQLRNMTIMRSGGVQNRPGTNFIGEVLDPSKETRLVPLTYYTDSLVLEFGDETLRVISDDALVTKNYHWISAATQASPCVLTLRNYGDYPQSFALTNGCRITISGVTGMTQLNGNTYKIKNLTTTGTGIRTVELTDTSDVNIDSSAYGVFTQSPFGYATIQTSVTAATKASPCVLTIVGHSFKAGDNVTVSGIAGMTELNGRSFVVGTVTADGVPLKDHHGNNIDSSAYTTYVSGGTVNRVFVLPTPYQDTELADLTFSKDRGELTIAHPFYAAYVFKFSTTQGEGYTFTAHGLSGNIDAPVATSVTDAGAGTSDPDRVYKITAVDELTGEESLPSNAISLGAAGQFPYTVNWNAVTGAREYNVYVKYFDIYCFIGTAGSTSFLDDETLPDLEINPPYDRGLFAALGEYPAVVGAYQQRRLFGLIESVWSSRIDAPTSFQVPSPNTADGPVTFTLAGIDFNVMRHFVDAGNLVILTSSGEWVINGNEAGILTPTGIGAKQRDYQGCSNVIPVVAGGDVIFVQAGESVVRSFSPEAQGQSPGGDLTVYASHLFDGYTITELAYTRVPTPIVWARRSDGALLALTYIKEQEIWGWTKCDTDGEFKNLCSFKDGTEEILYFIVSRTVDGVETKYIEKMNSRLIEDAEDFKFLDSALTYDGRNVAATTMTLSGAAWTADDTITCTASASIFASTNVGDAVYITGADGTVIRFTIDGYTGATIVTGRPHMTVPVAMRATAFTTWSLAVDTVSGLWHLEGESVAVLGDGNVVANPLTDEAADLVTVTNGTITLDEPYAVIHVGLPYICDVETLDLDTQGGQSISDRNILVSRVSMRLDKSRGIYVGPQPPTDDDTDPLENLTPAKARTRGDAWGPVALATREIDVNIDGKYSRGGRVFVRQIDPLPLSILAITPHFSVNKER